MELKRMIFLLLVCDASSQTKEGDQCTLEYTNSGGLCKKVEECISANEDLIKNGIRPTFCSYSFDGPVVCCRDGVSILQPATRRTTTEAEVLFRLNFDDRQGPKIVSEQSSKVMTPDATADPKPVVATTVTFTSTPATEKAPENLMQETRNLVQEVIALRAERKQSSNSNIIQSLITNFLKELQNIGL